MALQEGPGEFGLVGPIEARSFDETAHQAAVPPTVIPSMSMLGWPTPAGTD